MLYLLLTQGLATLCYLSSFETLRALFPSIQADELDATLQLHVHSDRVTECMIDWSTAAHMTRR